MAQPASNRLLVESLVGAASGIAPLDSGQRVPDANLPARLGATALGATFVRFVDLAGNPISARHVTIKVDTSTWEIADIIAEA
jgi:hypothetical protein